MASGDENQIEISGQKPEATSTVRGVGIYEVSVSKCFALIRAVVENRA
jgi:hypothetical protein